jgi:uncharacterized membrane protein
VIGVIYNALSKIARRLHMNTDKYLAIATFAIPLGITAIFWGSDKGYNFLIYAGAIVALLGLVLVYLAISQAEKEKKERDKRDNHLIAVLEAIAKKLGAEVNKTNEQGEKK